MKYKKNNETIIVLFNGNAIKSNGEIFMQFVSETEAINWLLDNGWKEA